PHFHTVDLLQTGHQGLRELAGTFFNLRAADFGLQLQRLPERDHRRLVALAEAFEGLRHADAARIRAEDAGPDLRLRALVDVEHAVLFRPARPFVRAAAVEVGLYVGQIDVEQAECLRAVDKRQDPAV